VFSFMQPMLQNSCVNLNVRLHFYRRVKVLRVHTAAALFLIGPMQLICRIILNTLSY
jgi:hypothetical protein